jgi:hypothetical protein
MYRTLRRWRKALSLALLLLNVSGARVYASCSACEKSRTYFGPSLAFKMVARSIGYAAARQDWRSSAPNQLGEAKKHTHASDLAGLRRGGQAAPVALVPGAVVLLAALPRRAPPQTLQPLSVELGTAPPLHTRK